MNKQKRKFSKLTIVFYVLSILMIIYSLFTLYLSFDYIKGLVSAGQLTISNSISDVIVYFIANSMDYIFYAIAFAFFGYVIYLFKAPKQEVVIEEYSDELEDEDEAEEDLGETFFQQPVKEATIDELTIDETDD